MFSNRKKTTPSNLVFWGFTAAPVFRGVPVFRSVPMFRSSGVPGFSTCRIEVFYLSNCEWIQPSCLIYSLYLWPGADVFLSHPDPTGQKDSKLKILSPVIKLRWTQAGPLAGGIFKDVPARGIRSQKTKNITVVETQTKVFNPKWPEAELIIRQRKFEFGDPPNQELKKIVLKERPIWKLLCLSRRRLQC